MAAFTSKANITTAASFQQTSWLNTSRSCESPNPHREIDNTDILVYTCYVIISITGCVCNSITIAIMAKSPSLHTLYNFLLLNLAIADLLSSIFSIIKFIIIICADQSGGMSHLTETLTCRFVTTIIYWSIIIAILTLTAICLERYFGIVKPMIHRNMTPKRLKYFLISAWVTTPLVPAILSGQLKMDKTKYYCFYSNEEEDWPGWKIIIGWIIITIGYITPLVVISIIYVKIIIHMGIKKNAPDIATTQNSQGAEKARKKARKTIRLLILITVLFWLAILPELIYFAMMLSDIKYIDAALFYKIGIPTVAINAVNPLIYTLSNSSFRSAAERLIRRPRPRKIQPMPITTRTTVNTNTAKE